MTVILVIPAIRVGKKDMVGMVAKVIDTCVPEAQSILIKPWKVGKVTQKQLEDIAEQKMVDLSANDVKAGAKIIAGTARSMGIETE